MEKPAEVVVVVVAGWVLAAVVAAASAAAAAVVAATLAVVVAVAAVVVAESEVVAAVLVVGLGQGAARPEAAGAAAADSARGQMSALRISSPFLGTWQTQAVIFCSRSLWR